MYIQFQHGYLNEIFENFIVLDSFSVILTQRFCCTDENDGSTCGVRQPLINDLFSTCFRVSWCFLPKPKCWQPWDLVNSIAHALNSAVTTKFFIRSKFYLLFLENDAEIQTLSTTFLWHQQVLNALNFRLLPQMKHCTPQIPAGTNLIALQLLQ